MTTADFDFGLWLSALPLLLVAATLTWLLSLPLRNVSIVDSLWSLMLFAAGVMYALDADPRAPRLALVLWLLAIWAARLSIYLTARSVGQGRGSALPGDPRAPRAALRAQEPVPGVLAAGAARLGRLAAAARRVRQQRAARPRSTTAASLLWLAGFVFEAGGDWQLARFSATRPTRARS